MKAIAERTVRKVYAQRPKAEKHSVRFGRIKGCIFLSGLSVFAQLYLFQPMLTLLCKEFKITPAHSSLAVSACTVGMAAGLFLFAFKADNFRRKKLMSLSLLISSILTIISAFARNFELLILLNFLKGVVLSGVSAVALAYLSEEVHASTIGLSISLYLAGNTAGGMLGRVVATLISGWIGWQGAVGVIGVSSLLLGLGFMRYFPDSRHFVPASVNVRKKLQSMGSFLRNPLMLRLYLIAALLMGSFVSIYNYLGFRLEAAPFSLPHYIIAFIFLMYTVGIGGSMVAGKWSDRFPAGKILLRVILLMPVGLLLMVPDNLPVLILGLGLFTFSFFGAHTMASRIVSLSAREGRSTATSMYWLFYYLGSSLIGSSTGITLSHYSWPVFTGCLMVLVLAGLVFAVRSHKK